MIQLIFQNDPDIKKMKELDNVVSNKFINFILFTSDENIKKIY